MYTLFMIMIVISEWFFFIFLGSLYKCVCSIFVCAYNASDLSFSAVLDTIPDIEDIQEEELTTQISAPPRLMNLLN